MPHENSTYTKQDGVEQCLVDAGLYGVHPTLEGGGSKSTLLTYHPSHLPPWCTGRCWSALQQHASLALRMRASFIKKRYSKLQCNALARKMFDEWVYYAGVAVNDVSGTDHLHA